MMPEAQISRYKTEKVCAVPIYNHVYPLCCGGFEEFLQLQHDKVAELFSFVLPATGPIYEFQFCVEIIGMSTAITN